MAFSQSTVKNQVSKSKLTGQSTARILKNLINKPLNDYSKLLEGQKFVIADHESMLMVLEKKEGRIIIVHNSPSDRAIIKVVNILTGKEAHEDEENQDEISLYKITKSGKEICKVTVGGGIIANIKKPDLQGQVRTWVEV